MANPRRALSLLFALTMACGGGPTAPSPAKLTADTPEVQEITVKVTTKDSLGISEATVTCLTGCDSRQVVNTDTQGRVTFTGNDTLTVRAEKNGYISVEKQVSNGDNIVLEREPVAVTITVELPYPEDANGIHIRIGISEARVTCVAGCDEQTEEVTDQQGEVTLVGRLPLTIRAEKSGHITVEHQTYGGRVNMGHEWPPELDTAIRQLGLGNAIATSELSLIWEDEAYFDARVRNTGNNNIGGEFHCLVIITRNYRTRNDRIRILAHEALHAWQGRRSNNPPCDLHYGYPPTEEAKEWDKAWEQDVEEHGPFPGIDGTEWGGTLLENQAEIYSYWYWGNARERAELDRLAPNRVRYLEDRFGSPPPR